MLCCKYNASSFSNLIVIKRVTRVADGQGGWTSTWAADPAGGVYAHLEYLTGTERWEANRMQGGDLVRGIIRFRGDGNGAPYYTVADKAILRGMEFAILSVQDIEFQQRFLQLEMMLGKPT